MRHRGGLHPSRRIAGTPDGEGWAKIVDDDPVPGVVLPMPNPGDPAENWGIPLGTGSDRNFTPDPSRRVGNQLQITCTVLVRRLVLVVQSTPDLKNAVQVSVFDLD